MTKYWVEARDRLGEIKIAVEADNEWTAAFRAGMALVVSVETEADTTVPVDTVADPDWDSSLVLSGMPEVLVVREDVNGQM